MLKTELFQDLASCLILLTGPVGEWDSNKCNMFLD